MTRLRSLIKEVLSQESPYYIIQSLKTGSPKYIASVEGEKPSWVPDSRIKQAHKFATLEDAKNYLSKFDTKRTAFWHIYRRPYDLSPKDVGFGRDLKESKKDCNCGCGGCDKKAPIITEGRIKKAISEGLTYHVENKIPLHESVYRIGSEKHFTLINEARKLWVRGLIDVSEDDQAILETHLGNFGMYEGEKVPLDMPMVHESTFQGNEIAIYGGEDGETYIEKRGTGYYGYNNSFDFTAKDKAELKQMLSMWGYYPIAGSINEDIYDKFLDDPQSPKGRAKAIISKFIKQYGKDASGMAVDRFAKQNNLKPEEKYILQYITKNDISISSKPGGPDFSALKEATSKYPDFDLDKNIKYQDTSISSGMWRYTGKEQGGKGVYRNLMNDQFLGFSSDDFDFFKKHLGSHFDISESLNEVEIGDTVKIDKNYGGGRGVVDDKVGSYVIINGKSYHESDVKVINSLNEDHPLFNQTNLSPTEYQKAKTLKGWNERKDDYTWNPDTGLWTKEKKSSLKERINTILEAKKKKKKEKKDPPLNKPERGGSKAYYVYVRDPKTKKIKKVSFGSGGLRAKIKNKEARNAFAARHNCDKKKDRTKAGYWSCNLPRYADQLGLGSKMNTFW